MPDETLHQVLIALNTTIAVAESLTCGSVQTHLGAVPGASVYFLGGMTAYNIDQKVEHLGVDGTHASSVNCVSQQVAREMASGIRALMGSEIGISTTGYAMPESGVDVPYAWVGFNLFDTTFERKVTADTSMGATPKEARIEFQQDVGQAVLGILLEWFALAHAGSLDLSESTRELLEGRGFFSKPFPGFEHPTSSGMGYY